MWSGILQVVCPSGRVAQPFRRLYCSVAKQAERTVGPCGGLLRHQGHGAGSCAVTASVSGRKQGGNWDAGN